MLEQLIDKIVENVDGRIEFDVAERNSYDGEWGQNKNGFYSFSCGIHHPINEDRTFNLADLITEKLIAIDTKHICFMPLELPSPSLFTSTVINYKKIVIRKTKGYDADVNVVTYIFDLLFRNNEETNASSQS